MGDSAQRISAHAISRGVLLVTGLFWMYHGVLSLEPNGIIGMICSSELAKVPDGAIEVQGTYGGGQLGGGIWLVFAAVDPAYTRAGLLSLVSIYLSGVVVRGIAAVATGWDSVGSHQKNIMAYELLTCLVVSALASTRRGF